MKKFLKEPAFDWYLPEWLKYMNLKATPFGESLGWNKSKASLFMSLEQRYHRDDVNDAARALNIKPFELLMHPDEASLIKRLRFDIVRLKTISDENASKLDSAQKKFG